MENFPPILKTKDYIINNKDYTNSKSNNNNLNSESASSELVFDYKNLIKSNSGEVTDIICPKCKKILMLKKINNREVYCHPDFRTGNCAVIYNSIVEIEEDKIKYQTPEEKFEKRKQIEYERARKEALLGFCPEKNEYLTEEEIEELTNIAEKAFNLEKQT